MTRMNAIIVGMARSGTSLSASIFANYGYFVADDPDRQLTAASRYNPSGYWELDKLIDANVRILNSVGFSCHNTWNSDEIREDQADAIFSLEQTEADKDLARHFSGHQPWVWKDPRFCYTLAYWWPLMNAERTRVLLVTRNPDDIWRSFSRTGWREGASDSKQQFLQRIDNHLTFARRTIARFEIPYLEMDYSDYAKDAAATATRLGDYFGLKLRADELGYQSKFSTSSYRGKMSYSVERVVSVIPRSLRSLLRKALPGFVRKALFPTRVE